MNTLTIYARKNPDKSVTIYRDETAQDTFCVIPHFYITCPNRRNKRIRLNSITWNLCWI